MRETDLDHRPYLSDDLAAGLARHMGYRICERCGLALPAERRMCVRCPQMMVVVVCPQCGQVAIEPTVGPLVETWVARTYEELCEFAGADACEGCGMLKDGECYLVQRAGAASYDYIRYLKDVGAVIVDGEPQDGVERTAKGLRLTLTPERAVALIRWGVLRSREGAGDE